MPRLELTRPYLIGVVHLLPTPGSPRHRAGFDRVLERAVADAEALASGGCDALLVENFGDAPFHAEHVPAETVAAMALALSAVRESAPGIPVGVNVLRNDARAALGLCAVTGASFLRVNVHCGVVATDQGLLEGRAAETLRERARLARSASILADVHVKHGHTLHETSIRRAAQDLVQRGLADAVVATGAATGAPPEREALEEIRECALDADVILGSGLDLDNAARLLPLVDGAIVGTGLKVEGRIENPVDRVRVERLRAAFERLRRAR